jgi:release factor glutamine methyltransferase
MKDIVPDAKVLRHPLGWLRSRLGNPGKDFDALGRRWILMSGVFSPIESPTTELFSQWLPYPVGGSLLEIGCGTGVTAVHGLLSGCRHVVAVDINHAAISNTWRNAERHGVSERISVRYSDLYESLEPDEQFDLIFWNSNFIDGPDDHTLESDLDHAYFDPGYRVHRRYLRGASSHLRQGGRLFLGFSSLGNWEELRRACSEAGLEPTVVRSEVRQLGSLIDFQLIELHTARHGTEEARHETVSPDT